MEEFSRPEPRRGPADGLIQRWNEWVSWVGLGRLVGSALAVVVVCLGGLWLVRSPPPPTEASLPRAAASTSLVTATLPPPTGGPSSDVSSTVDDAVRDTLTVHVAGAVERPGVYELDVGARVIDAIRAAGGATGDGRPDELNLAAAAVDGSRIRVPVEGETVESTAAAAGVDPVVTGDGASTVGPIDLNSADRRQLETLPGIGPATADAIVIERERGGPFLTVDELERVPGIGPGKLGAIRDLVTV